MIVIKLSGGLGNQMFEYAMAKHLALRNRTVLKIDLTFLQRRKSSMRHTPREYALGIFAMDPCFFSLVERGMYKLRLSRLRRRREAEFQLQPGHSSAFNPTVLELPDHTYLEGVFPSPDYFQDIEAEIRRDFSFRTPLAGGAREIAERMALVNAVGVHVRRGDYVTNPRTARMYDLCPPSYYQVASVLLRERGVKEPHFFVFSDDIPWCRENLRFDAPTTFVGDEYAGEGGTQHFQLLTGCRHFIIPNSTFSWWAAWLSTASPEKVVVAPKHWARHDIGFNPVPSGWVILDAILNGDRRNES